MVSLYFVSQFVYLVYSHSLGNAMGHDSSHRQFDIQSLLVYNVKIYEQLIGTEYIKTPTASRESPEALRNTDRVDSFLSLYGANSFLCCQIRDPVFPFRFVLVGK